MNNTPVTNFLYDLPEELIAQHPVYPRDSSKLMIVDRISGDFQIVSFNEIGKYLPSNSTLILNNSRVMAARVFARKITGARIEVLFLKKVAENEYEALVRPKKRLKSGDVLEIENSDKKIIVGSENSCDGYNILFQEGDNPDEIIHSTGKMPLPPYIHEELDDQERYQTVFSSITGSAAAPTAGLHFTPELLNELSLKGIENEKITLHVGLGTFRPVSAEFIENHSMHSEEYGIDEKTAFRLNQNKNQGKKMIAVGTTVCRVLESESTNFGEITSGWKNTDIFIYNDYQYKFIDGLLTNFHLPGSTLLMLVCAFLGKEKTMNLYNEAVKRKMRFFSFGDAMLIL